LLPPVAGVDAAVFERSPEPADRCFLRFGQPGPVERQIPAQVPAGRTGAGKGPVQQDDRSVAAQIAAEALAVARSLGAAPLAADLELLSRRGRLAAGSSPADALRRLGLTEREAEVLGLLAEGRTNRQIGDALFISEKTASVHVTNLLRKLGVGSRVEAAEMSRRLR
jgi:DNA-binding CsgD family transcriptional regulator